MAAQLVLRSFSEGGRVTTENAPFADRNKKFLPFLKTFEIASGIILYSSEPAAGDEAEKLSLSV